MTSSQDDAPTSQIAAEIRLIRKGRGIRARDLPQRIGPHLRELIGDSRGDASDLRRNLASELSSCAARLPEDLSTAVLASLALLDETRQMEHFGDRVTWFAERVARNERTVLRRIDDAEKLLAEEVSTELSSRRGRVVSSTNGWYLDEFRTVLRLDTATPESHGAAPDRLDQIRAFRGDGLARRPQRGRPAEDGPGGRDTGRRPAGAQGRSSWSSARLLHRAAGAARSRGFPRI